MKRNTEHLSDKKRFFADPEFLSDTNPLFAELKAMPDVRIPETSGRVTIRFWLVLLGGIVITSLLSGIIGSIAPVTEENATLSLIVSLFLTAVVIILTLLFCRKIENRPLRTTGMKAKGFLPQYLCGAAAGFVMFGGAVLMAWACGALTFSGRTEHFSAGTMAVLLFAWLVQGFSEEISFRGWLMISVGTHRGVTEAVTTSGLYFAIAHIGNQGISIPAMINLGLFGMFAGLYVLRTGSIWGAAAMHGVWNFVQGNLFGIKVSGMDMPDSVLRFSSEGGSKWLNGGAFGMEGGLCVTAVLVIGILLLWKLPQRAVPASVSVSPTDP